MVFNVFLQFCSLKLRRQLLPVEVIKVMVISHHLVLCSSSGRAGKEWMLGCRSDLELARLYEGPGILTQPTKARAGLVFL